MQGEKAIGDGVIQDGVTAGDVEYTEDAKKDITHDTEFPVGGVFMLVHESVLHADQTTVSVLEIVHETVYAASGGAFVA